MFQEDEGTRGGELVAAGVSRLVWWANVCLLAASEPVNHYGLRKRLRPTPSFSSISTLFALQPPSVASFVSLLPSCTFRQPRLSLLLRIVLSSISLSHSPSRSSPSFPSVASSPRCFVLQARYNAARCRHRPSCIFKRAVLLCSHPHHHLRTCRPPDDRSPPSPIDPSPPSPLPTSTPLCHVRSCPARPSLAPRAFV